MSGVQASLQAGLSATARGQSFRALLSMAPGRYRRTAGRAYYLRSTSSRPWPLFCSPQMFGPRIWHVTGETSRRMHLCNFFVSSAPVCPAREDTGTKSLWQKPEVRKMRPSGAKAALILRRIWRDGSRAPSRHSFATGAKHSPSTAALPSAACARRVLCRRNVQ